MSDETMLAPLLDPSEPEVHNHHNEEDAVLLVPDNDNNEDDDSVSSSVSSRDDDDISTNSRFHQGKHFCYSMTNSFLENLAFLLGSTFYLWIDLWTLRDELMPSAPEKGADDTTTDDYIIFADWDLWDVLNLLGPLFFVVNAILVLFHLATTIPVECTDDYYCSLLWEILVVMSFGTAALIEFFNYLLVDQEEQLYFTLSSIAMHLYLLEAILAFSRRKRHRNNSTRSSSQWWYVWGDILFFVGSLLDVLLSYFERADTTNVIWDHLQYASVVSSLLWFFDPILYMIGDWNYTHRILRRQEQERAAQ